ncbi:MAG: transaldolase family protein, partial [Nocardioides sp.]
DGPRWDLLAAAGANRQRPLWASTGVKNPDYDDTMYVVDLAVGGTVNTMPQATLDAVADHGVVRGDRVRLHYADARRVMADLADAGIDYDKVIATLIAQGVTKFIAAWDDVLDTVRANLDAARRP